MVKKLFAFTLFLVTNAWCAPSITLDLTGVRFLKDRSGKLQPTAFLNETFSLQATVVGGRERVRVEGLEHFVRQGTSQSSNISVDNSKMLVEQTIEYKLAPKKEGTFVIGPASTRIDGKIIESNKVVVHVKRRPHQVPNTESEAETEAPYKIFCELSTNKKNVFTEEPFVITLSLYHRGSGYNIRGIIPPQFPNCTVKEEKKGTQFKQDKNGVTYSVLQKRYLVFANKPGKIKISPASAIYNVKSKRPKRGLGFFDDEFFSNFFSNQAQQKAAPSNSISINVEKLPTDKEAQGVGTFSRFTAWCDKKMADVNEPITLTLELEGSTNFDLILPPKLSLPNNFKSYDSKTDFLLGKNISSGIKKFSFIIQVPEQGTWTVPKQTFSYFDTKDKKFKTLVTEPIPLEIKLPRGYTPPSVATPAAPTPVVKITPQKDIHFIEENAPATKQHSIALPLWLLIMLILLITGVFYVGAVAKTFEPLKNKFVSQKKNIFNMYKQRITDAIEFNECEKLYSLFVDFISERTNIPRHEVTHARIGMLLEKVSVDRVDRFRTFLKECAQYSYASTDRRIKDMIQLQQEALDWLRFLNKNL
jgi:hypothetical protein